LSESNIRDKAFHRPPLKTTSLSTPYNLHQKHNYLLGKRGHTDETFFATNSTVDRKESVSLLVKTTGNAELRISVVLHGSD
jgi:hypothetical protein